MHKLLDKYSWLQISVCLLIVNAFFSYWALKFYNYNNNKNIVQNSPQNNIANVIPSILAGNNAKLIFSNTNTNTDIKLFGIFKNADKKQYAILNINNSSKNTTHKIDADIKNLGRIVKINKKDIVFEFYNGNTQNIVIQEPIKSIIGDVNKTPNPYNNDVFNKPLLPATNFDTQVNLPNNQNQFNHNNQDNQNTQQNQPIGNNIKTP